MCLRYQQSSTETQRNGTRCSKRGLSLWGCLFLLIVLLTACSNVRTLPTEYPVSPTEPLTWLVCVQGMTEDNFFEDNRIGQLIAEYMPEVPQVRFSRQDATTEFSLLYASGMLPDIFTAETQDNVIRLCRKKAYSYAVQEVSSSLLQAIPAETQPLFEKCGQGHGIPGGFLAGDSYTACFCEGIYVRRKYIGDTQIYNKQEFIQLVKDITAHHHASKLIKNKINPILLNTQDQPFETLEHLFGIRPFCYQGENIGHRIFEENWPALLSFLCEVGEATHHMLLLQPQDLQTAMKNEDIQMYIGRHDPVANANRELASEEQFIPIYPQFSQEGFLQIYSTRGQYMTFLCRNGQEHQQRAAACLNVLLTERLGRLAMFGEENRDWIYDEGNGDMVPISVWQTEQTKMEQGILCFPFLSTVGLEGKGYTGPLCSFDILTMCQYEKLYVNEMEEIYSYALEQKIEEALTEIIEKDGWNNEKLDGLLTRLRQSSELMYLDAGIP